MHVNDTNPYPWPYDGLVSFESMAVVVCGAQPDIIDRACGASAVMANVSAIIVAARANGSTVMWLRYGSRVERERPRPMMPTYGTPDWELAITPSPNDDLIDCVGWDGCFSSVLDHTLRSRGIRTVLLTGFASEVTVDSTVRTLNDQGHECLVVSDACAPLDVGLGVRALHSLTMSGGIFGAHGTTAAVLDLFDRLTHPSTLTSTLIQETTP
ncbi:MAG: Cysteine hydrolase [Acidimicrobiales bacterium]|nr:Cysteine hydrolase [Acidimicrobiales bacterium]